jgi:hypothetical protein
MGNIRAAGLADSAIILTQLITFLSQFKPSLNRDEAFLIGRVEADLQLISAEGFDKNNATQAHRLYLALERLNQLPDSSKQIQVPQKDTTKIIINIDSACQHIQKLQTQQHASLLVILNLLSKLGLAQNLSVHEQQRLVMLEMKILNTFKQPDLAPDDKLKIIVDEVQKTSNAKGPSLAFFTTSSKLNSFLKEIITTLPNLPNAPENQPTTLSNH